MKGGAKEKQSRERREDICGDAEDNGRLCPQFYYWLVFNVEPLANHIRDTLSERLSQEPVATLRPSIGLFFQSLIILREAPSYGDKIAKFFLSFFFVLKASTC